MVDRLPPESADPPPLGPLPLHPPALHLPTLSEDIAELIASGVDACVATRDAQLMPEVMQAMGARVHADLRTFTVYVAEALSEATVRNLKANGEVAITLTRPADHKSVQLKGQLEKLRRSTEADRDVQSFARAAMIEQFALIGIPRQLTRRLKWWPSLAIEVSIRQVFQQTPGPGAGEPLRRGSL